MAVKRRVKPTQHRLCSACRSFLILAPCIIPSVSILLPPNINYIHPFHIKGGTNMMQSGSIAIAMVQRQVMVVQGTSAPSGLAVMHATDIFGQLLARTAVRNRGSK